MSIIITVWYLPGEKNQRVSGYGKNTGSGHRTVTRRLSFSYIIFDDRKCRLYRIRTCQHYSVSGSPKSTSGLAAHIFVLPGKFEKIIAGNGPREKFS